MGTKYIYFVRHGETVGNVNRFSQDMFTELTPNGHKQALRVAERCTNLGIQKMYTSTMTRAVQTGEYISNALKIDSTESELFREWMTPKSVRGKTYDTPEYAKWATALAENHTNPDWRYEDAENFGDLIERANAAVTLLESGDEEHTLIVSHGKFLRFFCAYILHRQKLTAEKHFLVADVLRITNTGITVYKIKDGVWSLITWNDVAHFAE